MKKYVICKLCGKKLKQISTGHMTRHNINIKDYKLMFPDAEITSEFTKFKNSESTKLCHKLNPQSEETKRQISQTMKKVYSNPNFSLNKKNSDQKGDKNHFYGKHHSNKTKAILSAKTTEYLKKEYKEGKRTSAFKYLGQSKGMSKYEKIAFMYLNNLGFTYDYPISFSKGRYLIDFAHVKYKIAIELDSKLHDKTKERDKRKDTYLKSRGWKVYRFKFHREKPNEVALRVYEFCKKLIERRNNEDKINKKKRKPKKLSY